MGLPAAVPEAEMLHMKGSMDRLDLVPSTKLASAEEDRDLNVYSGHICEAAMKVDHSQASPR